MKEFDFDKLLSSDEIYEVRKQYFLYRKQYDFDQREFLKYEHWESFRYGLYLSLFLILLYFLFLVFDPAIMLISATYGFSKPSFFEGLVLRSLPILH